MTRAAISIRITIPILSLFFPQPYREAAQTTVEAAADSREPPKLADDAAPDGPMVGALTEVVVQ